MTTERNNRPESLAVRTAERPESLAILARRALDVQDACNLSGVAHAFSRVMTSLGKHVTEGTDARNGHAVTRLFAYKLASLAGMEPIDAEERYSLAEAECQRLAREPEPEVVREKWRGTYVIGNARDDTTRIVILTLDFDSDTPVADIDDCLREQFTLEESIGEDVIDGGVECL